MKLFLLIKNDKWRFKVTGFYSIYCSHLTSQDSFRVSGATFARGPWYVRPCWSRRRRRGKRRRRTVSVCVFVGRQSVRRTWVSAAVQGSPNGENCVQSRVTHKGESAMSWGTELWVRSDSSNCIPDQLFGLFVVCFCADNAATLRKWAGRKKVPCYLFSFVWTGSGYPR